MPTGADLGHAATSTCAELLADVMPGLQAGPGMGKRKQGVRLPFLVVRAIIRPNLKVVLDLTRIPWAHYTRLVQMAAGWIGGKYVVSR
jgi:hypothetical protein